MIHLDIYLYTVRFTVVVTHMAGTSEIIYLLKYSKNMQCLFLYRSIVYSVLHYLCIILNYIILPGNWPTMVIYVHDSLV